MVNTFATDGNGVKTGAPIRVTPFDVCVEDTCIMAMENTRDVIDLDVENAIGTGAVTDVTAKSVTLLFDEAITNTVTAGTTSGEVVVENTTAENGDGLVMWWPTTTTTKAKSPLKVTST